MSAELPILSDRWHQVARLRPQLAAGLRWERQGGGRRRWWVIGSEDGRRNFRLDAAAYAFVGRCDGRSTMDDIWAAVSENLGDAAGSQDEFIRLMGRLHQEGWLRFDAAPDFASLLQERSRAARARHRFNPFAIRLRLCDPQRMLLRLDPLATRLFSAGGLWAWAALVLAGCWFALEQRASLAAHAETWLQSPRYWMLTWCVYPAIKLVHELAHALAIRRWGGQVREAGLTVLMLTPVPHVDASAANAFPARRQRVIVSLAGIMAELAVAAAGVLVWVTAGPGLVRDIAFICAFIGTVSTLAVNANPLLRFDGYFALCDAMDLPNLAARSRRWWNELIWTRVLQAPGRNSLPVLQGERLWLSLHAPLSMACQVAFALMMSLWIARYSPAAAMLLAATCIGLIVGHPLWRLARDVWRLPAAADRRSIVLRRAALASGLLLGCLAAVPLPDHLLAQGVVWLPDEALVRSGTDGFVEEVLVEDGAAVEAGQLLLTLANPRLQGERERLAARLQGLTARHVRAMNENGADVGPLEEEIRVVAADIASRDEELGALQVRARVAGRLVMPEQSTLLGRFARQGELIAYVATDSPGIVRIALPQQRSVMLRSSASEVQVQLAEQTIIAGRLARDTLAADPRLPSAALSTANGGDFVTDPADEEHRLALAPIVTMDVEIGVPARLGARAWVRFEHGYRPLALQWARDLRQSMLQRQQQEAG